MGVDGERGEKKGEVVITWEPMTGRRGGFREYEETR